MTVAPFITLVGASGSGKTTLIRHLLEHIPRTKFLKLYTTRPPDNSHRKEDTLSFEYTFVSREQYYDLEKKAGEANWGEA